MCIDLDALEIVLQSGGEMFDRRVFNNSSSEELAKKGEEWDKIGWGGTISPYLASKKYLNSITPKKTSPKEWFTTKGLKEYQTFPEKPSVRALHMAMFLKTLELI